MNKYRKQHLYLTRHTYLEWLYTWWDYNNYTPCRCSPFHSLQNQINSWSCLGIYLLKALTPPSVFTDRWVKCWVKVHTSFLGWSIKSSMWLLHSGSQFSRCFWWDLGHVVRLRRRFRRPPRPLSIRSVSHDVTRPPFGTTQPSFIWIVNMNFWLIVMPSSDLNITDDILMSPPWF